MAELSKNVDVLPERVLNKSIDIPEIRNSENIIPNTEKGLEREHQVEKELQEKYPESEGYEIVSEAYLRDSEGRIVKDPETGTARRVDFVVTKDGKVVDSIEVTSETCDKTAQMEKEQRVREAGGNYIETDDGSLAKYPDNLQTRIERKQ